MSKQQKNGDGRAMDVYLVDLAGTFMLVPDWPDRILCLKG